MAVERANYRHEALIYAGEDDFVAKTTAFLRDGVEAGEPALFVVSHAVPGARLRGIGEPIYPERTADELVECQRHEALLNLAFADTPGFWLLCPYDADAMPTDVIDEAQRTHPYVMDGESRESPSYYGLETIEQPFGAPLATPPEDAV